MTKTPVSASAMTAMTDASSRALSVQTPNARELESDPAIRRTAAKLRRTARVLGEPSDYEVARTVAIYLKEREQLSSLCPDGDEWVACPECNGRGQTFGVECPSCNGYGGNCVPRGAP